MSKILGLDISTCTGWALVEDQNLLDFGSIQINSRMNLPQKLNFLSLEIERIIERLHPDICAIEDVILGISGAKTLAYLARLNGVVINSCFSLMRDNIYLYEPTTWKANSVDNLKGSAKKWQVQLSVCKHFNIELSDQYEKSDILIKNQEKIISEYKNLVQHNREIINKLKNSIVRKRKPLTKREKNDATKQIRVLTSDITNTKKHQKESEKLLDKDMISISLDITAQTGLTTDICDACGIAICCQKEIQ